MHTSFNYNLLQHINKLSNKMNEVELKIKLKAKKAKKHLILNARGIKYDILSDILDRLPNSRLAQLKKLIDQIELNKINTDSLLNYCDDYNLERNEFYFNRDPYILNLVLNFYTNGKLHMDHSTCVMLLYDELKYWIIDESILFYNCCEWKFVDKRDEVMKDIANEKKVINKVMNRVKFDNFIFPKLREKIWCVLEEPSRSLLGKVVYLLYNI